MSDSCDSMDCIAPGSSVHVCYWNQLRFLKQRSLSGSRQKGSLSSCVAGDVFIWVICLEVNASLKWMPWQSKLKLDICFKKKKRQKPKKNKKIIRAYTTMMFSYRQTFSHPHIISVAWISDDTQYHVTL